MWNYLLTLSLAKAIASVRGETIGDSRAQSRTCRTAMSIEVTNSSEKPLSKTLAQFHHGSIFRLATVVPREVHFFYEEIQARFDTRSPLDKSNRSLSQKAMRLAALSPVGGAAEPAWWGRGAGSRK